MDRRIDVSSPRTVDLERGPIRDYRGLLSFIPFPFILPTTSSLRTMYELPDHLASLNALAPSPPSTVLDQSAEEAVWNYLNTDALFSNFGATPAEWQEKHAAKEVQEARPTKETKSESAETPIAADLKSFIEQFAQKPDGNFNLFSFLPNDASASTTINTSDILPSSSKGSEATSPDDGRPSGAKKLKQLGADVAEIEEESVDCLLLWTTELMVVSANDVETLKLQLDSERRRRRGSRHWKDEPVSLDAVSYSGFNLTS